MGFMHRVSPLLICAGVILGPITGIAPKGGFALAQSTDKSRGIELLTKATRSYEAGAYSAAMLAVEEAFKAGLDAQLAARAILLRAEIHERTGKLARAMSDYSNALWMESLPPAEKKIAAEGKERVMRVMGLSGPADKRQQSASSGNEGQSSGGISGFFGGLFGSDRQQPAQQQQMQGQGQPQTWQTGTTEAAPQAHKAPVKAAVVQPAPSRKPAPEKPAVKPKHTAAHVEAPKKVTLAQPQAEAPEPPVTDGFLINFGSAQSVAAGRSQALAIKAKLTDILVNRDLAVRRGNQGFRIVAGPYKVKSAAETLCNAIKKRNVPCEVTH